MSASAELLQDLAGRAAESAPDATALAMAGERVSYGELDRLSDRLAAALVAAGCAPGDRIALLVPKRPATVVAMHAVMKAGGIYVTLDAESPAARVARIIARAEPRLLLAVPAAAPLLDELAESVPLPAIWSLEGELRGERVGGERSRPDWDVEAAPPAVRVDPGDPAHLIFTSGSTGEPKGVIVSHRSVLAAVEWGVAELGTAADDRVSCHAPLHFDQSTADVYATLAAGAEVHLVPPDLSPSPRALAALIRDSELTQWCSVPAALIYMAKFDAVAEGDFPALRRVLWGGDVLPTPVLTYWMERLSHVSFTNLYGPTETTITSSSYTVPARPGDSTTPVPIGRACPGEELFLLDSGGGAVADGEIGEIHIGGVGVSAGYWRDDERTRASFVSDPRSPGSEDRVYRTGDLGRIDADGLAHFVGRADSQIKSRGYRIELGEVEVALASVAGVTDCAVVSVDDTELGGATICAAYVADGELGSADLRSALAKLLPPYMLPARWLSLDFLPQNQNGKVDRKVLREQFDRSAPKLRKARK